jgi:small GTP-binding protein
MRRYVNQLATRSDILGVNALSVPVYKVLLVGDPNVGKSSIIRRLLLDDFDETYNATIGVDLSAVALTIEAITPVILTVIDLGGQAGFTELRSQYYKGAHFAVFVYDITERVSFEDLPTWFDGLQEAVPGLINDELLGMVIGNKADMIKMRQVAEIEGRTYADELRVPFYETSAKTGENVNLAFNRIAKVLYAKHPPVKVGPTTAVD